MLDGDKVYKEKARKQGRECWRQLGCNFKQSDQDSLTEMVTTKGGEGDIRTSYRKVFRRENVKCKGSNGGAPGV